MSPLNIRDTLLAKHAQHIVLIHFPIALFISGTAFDLLSQAGRRSALAAAAYYNFLVAAISVFPVVATGLLAWRFQLEGQKLKGILLFHLIFGIASAILILWVWHLHFRFRRGKTPGPPRLRIPLELAGVAIISITAHLGGFLSGVNT